ncbi:MAG: vWA domain-containing protein [Chloroflexota bacterium]
MSEFRFAYPVALLLIPTLVGLFAAWARWWRPDSSSTYSRLRYPDLRLMRGLPASWRVRWRYLPEGLLVAAWILLVIGLARPQSGSGIEVIRGQGVDIVLAVDISTSMAALDFQPDNRLEAAKRVIADFIAGRTFDRIGLVVFARNAYHQAPLTLDYPVLLQLLEQIALVSELREVEGRQLDGTALGLGIASAANMLRESDTASKVIILLTDGANNAGVDPLIAADAARLLGIRVYTIGMGLPGIVNAPDREGNIIQIESDLNEESLRQIASMTNALYFRAEDTAGLQRIYQQIDRLERSDVERTVFVRWQDQAIWLILPALMLLLIERTLRSTVFQKLP